jgi:hypothetical protein
MPCLDDSPHSPDDPETTVWPDDLRIDAEVAIKFANRICALGALVLAVALSAGAGEPGANSTAASSNTITHAASVPLEPIPSPSVKMALAQALHEPQVDKRLNRLADLGAKLSLSEIPDALKAAGDPGELRERMVFKQAVLIRWSQLAPEDAFTQIAKLPESQLKAVTLREAAAGFSRKDPARAAAAAAGMSPGSSRTDMIVLIANVWAETNVNAALTWAGKLPDSVAKESALEAIHFVWVHSDPVAASRPVEKLRPGDTRNNLIASVAYGWAALDHPAAIRWANQLPDGPDKETALVNLAESWANQDPQAAAAFALKLPPGETRSQAGAMVASRWAKQDPRQAADWSWRSGDAGIRQRGVKEVLDLWAGVDAAECAKWLDPLPPGPDRDQAIRAFVTAATMWAPDIAAREALLIEAEATRVEALNECLSRWREVDLPSATNWLNETKLPGPLKARWQQTATTQQVIP